MVFLAPVAQRRQATIQLPDKHLLVLLCSRHSTRPWRHREDEGLVSPLKSPLSGQEHRQGK